MGSPNLQLTGGNFQNGAGAVVSLGTLLFELSHDENYSSGPSQIVAGQKFTVTLNTSGSIPASPAFKVYANDVLLPSGSFYIVRLFDSTGAEVWASPQNWTFASSPSPLDIGTVVPSFPPGAGIGGSGATLLLETNGTANGNQSLQNLHSSDGSVVLTDDGLGDIDIKVNSGSLGSLSFMWGPGISLPVPALPSLTSESITDVDNKIYAVQFTLTSSITISKWSGFNAGGGSGTWDVGYYNSTGTVLLAHMGSQTAGLGAVTGTITPVTLSPGKYWYAFGASSHLQSTLGVGANSGNSNTITVLNANSVKMGSAANSLSSGNLPTSLGTITSVALPALTMVLWE